MIKAECCDMTAFTEGSLHTLEIVVFGCTKVPGNA